MYNLCRRLSVAISVSTLVFGFNCPVFAKPLTQAKIAVISQTDRAANQISLPPIEAILANVRIKPVIQPKVTKLKTQSQSKTKSTAKLTRSNQPKIVARQSNRNRPSSAAIDLFNIDRVTSRNDNFTAVNRLIE